jgi:hyaluronan synthase
LIPGFVYKDPSLTTRKNTRRKGMSIIIPVVDEPVDVFNNVLSNIQKHILPQDEVLVIQNGKKKNLRGITEQFGFSYKHLAKPSKRNALNYGITHARHELSILVDSDSIWINDVATKIYKAFQDPTVGGVTTHQFIPKSGFNWEQIIVNRYAGMIERLRNSIGFRSQSVMGQVGCLPGRTIAFRTSILRNNLDEFMNDYFLGQKIEFSDDRFLTNVTLMDGYKTIYLESALVQTDAPLTLSKYTKQQLRWARGSQINNLRMIPRYVANGNCYIALIYMFDTYLPFVWFGYLIGSAANPLFNEQTSTFSLFESLTLKILSITFTYLVKVGLFSSTFELDSLNPFKPMANALFFAFMTTFFLTPIRVYGFVTMLTNLSWGTRKGSYVETSSSLLKTGFKYVPFVAGIIVVLLNIYLGTL